MKKRLLAGLLTLSMLLGLFPGVVMAEESDTIRVTSAEELRVYLENGVQEELHIMADLTLDLSVTDEETGETVDGALVSNDRISSGFTGQDDRCVYALAVTGGTLTVDFADVVVRSLEEVLEYEADTAAIRAAGLSYILDGTLSVEEDTVLRGAPLFITDAGFVELADGCVLICEQSFYNLFPDEQEEPTMPLMRKHNGAADVLTAAEGKRMLYADMAALRAFAGEQPEERVEMILLCRPEGNSSYIKLDFDLPHTGLLQSYCSLEVGENVTVSADSLYVEGDCIWYPTTKIEVGDGHVEGRYPHLVAWPVQEDKNGKLTEREEGNFAGGYQFGRPEEENIDAFYAMYYDGGHWVTKPVSAAALQTEGSCWVEDRSAMALDPNEDHYAAYAMTEWNAVGAIYVEGAGGFDRLDYYVDCYLGSVNFFDEPRYDEDHQLSWTGISVLGGGTVYAASYLPVENLDVEWFLLDDEWEELRVDPERILDIRLMEEACDEHQSVWEICVSAETIRDYPEGLILGLRGTAVFEDGSEGGMETHIALHPQNALGWTEEDIDLAELTVSEFGMLRDRVTIPAGGSATGRIYMAYYDFDGELWRADRYSGDERGPWFLAEGDVSVTDGEDGTCVLSVGAARDGDDLVYWTNGHMNDEGVWTPNETADSDTLPLWVNVVDEGEGPAFESSHTMEAGETLLLPPLEEGELSFHTGRDGREATVTWEGTDDLTVEKQEDGSYAITVPQAVTRAIGYNGRELKATVDYGNDWVETCTLTIRTTNALVWGPGGAESLRIDGDDHGLSHAVWLREGGRITGSVYYVWYNDEESVWQADPYSDDYLVLEQDGNEAFVLRPAEENERHGQSVLECVARGESAVFWTNHAVDEEGNVTGPADGVDRDLLELRLYSRERSDSAFFEWDQVCEDGLLSHAEVSPLYGGTVYLGVPDEELTMESVSVSGLAAEVKELENGMYEIHIPAASARACVPQGTLTAAVRFADTGDGGWEEISLPVIAKNSMAWYDQVINEQIVLENDDHGLSPRLVMTPGESVTGTVCFVYYNDEVEGWTADPYGGDYLRMEGDEAFEWHNQPSDAEDDYNYDDTTVITCNGGGEDYLRWTNHALDEEGNVTGPAGETDYDCLPLVLSSNEPCLSMSWVNRNDDGWYEEDGRHTGCFITPNHGSHDHVFYLNWLDENGDWQHERVIPTVERVVSDDGTDTALDAGLVSLERVTDSGVEGHVRIGVNGWDMQVTLSAAVGEGEDAVRASKTFHVCLPELGFYCAAEISKENYVPQIDPVWGQDTAFWLGIRNEDDPAVRVEPRGEGVNVEAADEEGYLFKITLDEVTDYGRSVELDVRLESGRNEGVDIWVNGAENQSDWLGHRGLTYENNGWQINWNDDIYREIGQLAPGAGEWLVFYYVPYGGEPRLAEVEVTQGGDYVTLHKVSAMEDENIRPGTEGADYFYYLEVARGAWGKEVTLSATVDGTTVSDTFMLDRNHADFFADAEPDLEKFSDYLYELTLLPDVDPVFYLHLQPREDWSVEEVITQWYDEEAGEYRPLNGVETLKSLEPVEGRNDLYRVEFDPLLVRRHYANENFNLELQIRYRSPDGQEHRWGRGLRVVNRLPYLSWGSVEWRDEQYVLRDRRETGMRINPQQEFFQVYFLNVFDPETGRWSETPVHAEAVYVDGGENFVTVRPYEGNQAAEEIVQAYGCLVTVSSDSWGRPFAMQGSDGQGHTGHLRAEVGRDEINYYSAPSLNDDTFIDSFRLNDLSGGNVLYVGVELEEDAGHWIRAVRTDGWTDEQGEDRECGNADLVTVTRSTAKAYKVVIDREKARERFGQDGFDLTLNVVLEDGDGNIWDNPVDIWVENNLPFLNYKWLEWDGNAWYAPADRGLEDGCSMFPGDEFCHVYGLGYYDRYGNLTIEGVVPTVSGRAVTLERLVDREESIADNQTYGNMFVRLTAGEDAWDQTVTLTGTANGRTASMEIFVGRGEAEFHSSTAIENATCIREFAKDPLVQENNRFYLAIRKENPDWKVTLGEVKLRDESLATLTGKGQDENGCWIYEVTLSDAVWATDREFDLVVDYQWVGVENENERHGRDCRLHVYPGGSEGHVASVWADRQEVQFYRAEEGPAVAYTWVYDEEQDCCTLQRADWLNMTYAPDTNTLALNGVELESLYADTKLEPGVKTDALTLDLSGANSITGGRYGAALSFAGGLDVTVTGGEGSGLTVSSVNDDKDPWTHPALDLWENGAGELTITGQASVTLSVGGESYEVEDDGSFRLENGEKIPDHMNVIGTNDEADCALVVSGNATLTVLPPEGLLDRWSGLNGFKSVEVAESAVLNTPRLELYRDEAALRVLGGTVNVTMLGDDNGEDGYYFGGINVHNGWMTLAGGTVNVTAPAFRAEDTQVYANAVAVNGGSFGMTDGLLQIDLTGLTAEQADLLNGTALRLGDSEADNSMRFGQAGGAIRITGGSGRFTGVELCANAEADLQSGTLYVEGWQGVVNHGEMTVRQGMTITLQPWTDETGVQHATEEGGMFRNDLHYVMRKTSSLNLYGGELNITARDAHALVSQSEYLQTAGSVKLNTIHSEGGEESFFTAVFNGRSSLTGGSLTVDGRKGVLLSPEDYMTQNYFRLAGAKMTVNCGYNGVVATMPVSLQGGSLAITQGEAGADDGASALVVLTGGTLSVTGGEHRVFGFVKANGKSKGLQTYDAGAVKFLGGTTQLRGSMALLVNALKAGENPVQVGEGMYLASNNGGTDLKFYADEEPWEDSDGEEVWDVYSSVLGETVDGEAVLSTDVTIAAGQAPAVETTARVDVTTARPSVGALVTVQATVTAADGKASFSLEGLELAAADSGSITVNGVVWTGGLTDIPVEGSALIVFRVKPTAEGTAKVSCAVENADGSRAEDEASFQVHGFRMTAPTYTTYPQITVRGAAAPGEVITLIVTGGHRTDVTVTELGTFAAVIDLPVEEENYDAQSFSISAEMNGAQVGETLSVVYNPTSVRLDFLRITNEVTDSMGNPVRSTNTVSYESGTGMPERSFYTYIPGMNHFDFETQFYVPDGWIITMAKVVVSYQEDVDEQYTDLYLTEDTERQEIHKEDHARTEYWVWENAEDLPAAPIDFKVVYRVARVKDTVVPGPDDPLNPDDFTDDYVEEKEDRITDTVPVLPIIDPSGTIYSGSLNNPIAGATVTLYYGGSGAEPGEAVLVDMTPYNGQANPQITDESGHYGWDVPTGWWKVVAEKSGFRAESQWVHVLPAHTDLHLNLNMPSDGAGSYDLSQIRPLTINGQIPGEDFRAEVTVTNFTASEEALLLVAAYTAEGRFLSMQEIPVSGLSRGVTTTVEVEVTNPNGEAGWVKAFLVDGMEDMSPVSGMVEHRN